MYSLIAAPALLVAALFAGPSQAGDRPPPLVIEAEIEAPADQVWRALTTAEGATGFFAPHARVEPEIGGAYEIYFLPANAPGLRGSEGVRILAMEAPRRFLIGWNAPPSFGPLREQQTVVEFELTPLAGGRTLLTLSHGGWGRGPGWTRVRDYFAAAWPVVLGRRQYRFDREPVDWQRPPDGAAWFRARGRP